MHTYGNDWFSFRLLKSRAFVARGRFGGVIAGWEREH